MKSRIMGYTRRLVALTAFAVLAAAPAWAIEQQQEPQRPRTNRAAPLTNAQLATMLDAYAIVQAQTFLELTDEQYGQFVARLRRLQETRRRNMQARNKMLQELRRMTQPNAATDDAALRDRVKALRDLDEQAAQAMRREHEAVDELLSARQQARFRLFEERIEQQKLDLVMRAQQRAARGARGGRN